MTPITSDFGERVISLLLVSCGWEGVLRTRHLSAPGIHDFRWHDLRHTWTSWHVQNGTPLHALLELGGRETSEIVRRFAHFSAEHLAPYADRLCALRIVPERA